MDGGAGVDGGTRGEGGLPQACIPGAEVCPLLLPHINSTEKSLRSAS